MYPSGSPEDSDSSGELKTYWRWLTNCSLYRILYNKLIEELNEIKPPALATAANVEENTAEKPALYSPTEPILLWVKSYQIHSSY